MYLDAAYIAKYYVHEPESSAVRELVESARVVYSSVWSLAEVQCVFHRKMREGAAVSAAAHELELLFLKHADTGLWNFIPVTGALLRRAGLIVLASPPNIFLRAADAVHLTTAKELGEKEVWTSDRHMLAAASHFGLIGRSV